MSESNEKHYLFCSSWEREKSKHRKIKPERPDSPSKPSAAQVSVTGILEIVKICRAKSARLGLSDSKVLASEFRLLSCAIMRGMASMILNRDLYCDDINDDQSLND